MENTIRETLKGLEIALEERKQQKQEVETTPSPDEEKPTQSFISTAFLRR